MTEFKALRIHTDLKEFEHKLDAINVEKVKERTLKQVADEMAEMVRQAVIAEPKITTPSVNSKWGQGSAGGQGRSQGPSMSSSKAWVVEKTGRNSYTVSPHPRVRQRAIVLNDGYPGKITPNNAEYMKFKLEGVPMFRKEVDGPDATGYWQAALQRMEQSGKFERIGERELQREVDESL